MTLADLDRRRGEGAASAFQLKATTRMTMGRCQGRNCLPTLAMLAGEGADAETVAVPRARPPARPVMLGDLRYEDLPPPELPEDPHLPRARR